MTGGSVCLPRQAGTVSVLMIICLNIVVADYGDPIPAQVHLDFNVFLVDQKTGKHSMENRLLKFWFKPEVDPERQMWLAAEYFKELVNPETFPRGKQACVFRQMSVQASGQTDRRRASQLGRWPDRTLNGGLAPWETEERTDRQTDRQVNRQAEKETDIQKSRHSQKRKDR